jgi:hypothetical protein
MMTKKEPSISIKVPCTTGLPSGGVGALWTKEAVVTPNTQSMASTVISLFITNLHSVERTKKLKNAPGLSRNNTRKET